MFHADLPAMRKAGLKQDMDMIFGKQIVFDSPLTLNKAISVGLENNLDYRINKMMADIKNEKVLADKFRMLPDLNVDGRIRRRDEHNQTEYVNLETGETSLGQSVSEELTSKVISASLSWNILDFGISYFRARQSFYDAEVKRMEIIRQAQTLALDIAIAYRKAALWEKDLMRIREIEDEVKIYRNKLAQMVDQKRMDPMEVKKMEKKIADLSVTAGRMQVELSNARTELCRLMGVHPMTSFEIDGEAFQDALEAIPDPKDLDPEKLELISLKNRLELYAEDLRVKIQQDEAKAQLLSMFPGISFTNTHNYDDNKYLKNNYWYTIGTSVMWNLFSIPSKYVNWKMQEGHIEVKKLERVMLTAGVIVQAHMALHDFRAKKKMFQLQNDSFVLSKELLDMSKEHHELGRLSDAALTEQMIENAATKLVRDRSLMDLLNAYDALLVALGLDYSRWEENLEKMSNDLEGFDG